MPKFNVSCDLLIPVLLEIEAGDADEAIMQMLEMPRGQLLTLANTEADCISILDGSEAADEVVEK